MLALGSILLLTLSPLQIAVQQASPPVADPLGNVLRPAETWTTVLTGQVLDPDGRPAEGALVLTSAGGKAVCDADGAYRLAVDVPFGARELHLTAVLGAGSDRTLVGTPVDLRLLPPSVDVRPLTLAPGGTCQPDWLPTFGAYPGVNDRVYAMAVHDDGTGPALYVGGSFQTAGAVLSTGVARWDGTQWTGLGDELQFLGGTVYALEVFDDGNGAQLYAGGDFFDSVTPGAPNYIARWDGQSWLSVGGGATGVIRSLTVFDSGSGPALCAGGSFTTIGGVPASRIASWDGSTWSALGAGVLGSVSAMAVHTDLSGTALYVGGSFLSVGGGIAANRIARWSGSAWSAMGAGVNDEVLALASFDAGSGAQLFAGGRFTQASGTTANGLAVWNPVSATWSAPFALSVGSRVYALEPLSAPSGSWLSIARTSGFSSYLIRWQGGLDFLPTVQVSGEMYTAQHFDDGSGSGLRTYAGGFFPTAYQPGTLELEGVGNVLAVDFGTVSPLGTGLDNVVTAMAVHDDGSGSGPALFVTGEFIHQAIGTAKWDGTAWVDVAPMPVYGGVRALLSYDGPSGRELVAGGNIPGLGIVSSDNVVRFANGAWTGMSGGMNNEVLALAAWDDQTLGGVEALYAGGTFTTADGLPASRLARWDGVNWTAVGGGTNGQVNALAVFDDGSGEALYVAGSFTSVGGGIAANRIARWNGSTWSTLGSGLNNAVDSLCVFDDGTGTKLYAGGRFSTAGGVSANLIASWNGTSWSPLGGGLQTDGFDMTELEVFDDGSGPALFVGGDFWIVDGLAASGVARWSGSTWSALGAGVAGTYIDDLAGFGNALYLGGGFLISPGGDSLLARWGGCDPGPTTCTPSLTGPASLVAPQCGTVDGAYQITSDGSLGTGTWSLEYGPSFPTFDGWSATLVNSTSTSTTIEWITEGTSTNGVWLLLLTWTGTCNGLPVEWTFDVSCNLLQACPPPPPITAYCFGDGSGEPCPCGNTAGPGGGCANSLGVGAVLSYSGSSSVAAHDLVLTTSSAVPGKLCLYYQGTTPVGTLKKNLLSDGILCIGGSLKKLQSVTTGASGTSSTTADLAVKGKVQPGDVRYYQAWYRDVSPSPCGYAENRSNALEVHWVP